MGIQIHILSKLKNICVFKSYKIISNYKFKKSKLKILKFFNYFFQQTVSSLNHQINDDMGC